MTDGLHVFPSLETAVWMTIARHAAEIRAEGITKSFGKFKALDDVTLTIRPGEFLTLLGPSGSGKTTFLMILAGFEMPTAGRLHLDGADVTRAPAEARAFGMVFQGYALFPHMTVAQNIAFPLRVQHRRSEDIRKRTEQMITIVGLEGQAHKRPAALSGGQQQRVALARALAYEPPVLLLDEPLSALDRNLRGQMQDELRRLHAQTGTTFVFVTHDQSEALALSTRVAIFDHGRLQQMATPREVYDQPASRFVAEFLGDINILPLTGVVQDGAFASGRFEGTALRAPAPTGHLACNLAIRPEHMAVAKTPPAASPNTNALEATLTDLIYQGAETRLALRTEGGQGLTITQPTRLLWPGIAPGDQLWVSWPDDRGVFL
jgi:putative spermidine/putrescine transport system ATP-binding protein